MPPLLPGWIHKGRFSLGATNASYTGSLRLCYKFAFSGHPNVSPTPFLLFPRVRVALLRYDGVQPHGTATGCSANLTVRGAGFDALVTDNGLPVEAIRCSFTGLVGHTVATLVNDSMLHCMSSVPLVAGVYPMRVDIGELAAHLPDVSPTFGAFELAPIAIITSLLPAGGPYNLEWDVALEGQFQDWGAPRCRFGDWVGSAGTVLDATHAVCEKPRFPNDARHIVGAYPVAFSPNGQCFAPASSAQASFITYNSQVNALTVSGAPATSSTRLQIEGKGFVLPAMAGGLCQFTRVATNGATNDGNPTNGNPANGNPSYGSQLPPAVMTTTTLEVASATLAHCPSPASRVAGAWRLQVLQNGLTAEPALYSDPLLYEYDLSDTSVSATLSLPASCLPTFLPSYLTLRVRPVRHERGPRARGLQASCLL